MYATVLRDERPFQGTETPRAGVSFVLVRHRFEFFLAGRREEAGKAEEDIARVAKEEPLAATKWGATSSTWKEEWESTWRVVNLPGLMEGGGNLRRATDIDKAGGRWTGLRAGRKGKARVEDGREARAWRGRTGYKWRCGHAPAAPPEPLYREQLASVAEHLGRGHLDGQVSAGGNSTCQSTSRLRGTGAKRSTTR